MCFEAHLNNELVVGMFEVDLTKVLKRAHKSGGGGNTDSTKGQRREKEMFNSKSFMYIYTYKYTTISSGSERSKEHQNNLKNVNGTLRDRYN